MTKVCIFILFLNIQIASPACTELEVVMMDWLGKALQLPEQFLSGGKGGGVIQVKFCVHFPSEKVMSKVALSNCSSVSFRERRVKLR